MYLCVCVCVSLCVEVVREREREHCVTSTLKNAFDVDTVMEARGAGEAQSSEVWGRHIRFVDPNRSLYSYVTDEMFSQPVRKIKSQIIFLYICQLFLLGCSEIQ